MGSSNSHAYVTTKPSIQVGNEVTIVTQTKFETLSADEKTLLSHFAEYTHISQVEKIHLIQNIINATEKEMRNIRVEYTLVDLTVLVLDIVSCIQPNKMIKLGIRETTAHINAQKRAQFKHFKNGGLNSSTPIPHGLAASEAAQISTFLKGEINKHIPRQVQEPALDPNPNNWMTIFMNFTHKTIQYKVAPPIITVALPPPKPKRVMPIRKVRPMPIVRQKLIRPRVKK
jgi:hypothetical protein